MLVVLKCREDGGEQHVRFSVRRKIASVEKHATELVKPHRAVVVCVEKRHQVLGPFARFGISFDSANSPQEAFDFALDMGQWCISGFTWMDSSGHGVMCMH